MKYPIRKFGDPVLRTEGVQVERFDAALHELAEDMLETMYAAQGIGLAAQQIGKAVQFCVLDVPAEADLDEEGQPLNPGASMPLVLINPVIEEASDACESAEEGCLSFPGIGLPVTRPASVRVRYQDLDGHECEMAAAGLLGRAIQHEMDHLNGVLFIDHVSSVKKLAVKGRLKRLKKDTLQELEGAG